MRKYKVTGMSCAACVSRVEKAVLGVSGAEKCHVNLLLGTMNVQGECDEKQVIEAVTRAGYGIDAYQEIDYNKEEKTKDKEAVTLIKRFFYSIIFLLPLMYVSMGHTMWGFPLPLGIEKNAFLIGAIQGTLSLVLILINVKFFKNGIKGIIHLSPNMDTLVSLGSGVSFLYSVVRLVQLGITKDAHILHDLYFESAGMILVLITVGKALESYSKGKTTNAIKELISLQPRKAVILVDGEEKEIDVSEIKKDDIFVVKTGYAIPVDGTVLDGEGTVNEAMLTGESVPCEKGKESKVYAGTIILNGYLKCRADSSSKETVLSEIIKTVSDSASSKAPIARVADKVSGVFVPCVILVALITLVSWLAFGYDVGFALARGISVLVISCPCALGLATPVAIMVGNGVGARNGVLFKDATSLENAGKTNIAILDKTGTITKGEFAITDIIPFDITEEELMTYACSLECKSEHPLAKAIVKKGSEKGLPLKEAISFKTLSGSGVYAIIDGDEIYGGSFKSVADLITQREKDLFEKLSFEGKTPMFFAKNKKIIGVIAVRDEIKDDSAQAIEELKKMGIKTIMLTGDNKSCAESIGKIVGVDQVIADVMPMEKERIVNELKKDGRVLMVGDGINDSVALTSAHVGMAIGQGTEIAVKSAQVVLMKNSLMGVCHAIKISKMVLKNIYENLFWAFIYNIICIPLAMGLFINLFGWELNPMVGALAMSLSSFCVVTNSLRLNLIKLEKEKNDMFGKKKVGIVLKVEGMMCQHCEARVKKTLEAIEGVSEAIPNHKKNTVILYGEFDLEQVKEAVTKEGYTVK